MLSVFAALRALLYDVIDRLPLLSTLQNTAFYSLFIKSLSYTMPMLQASIKFIFLSLHLPFFFVNSSMKPPKSARVSTE